MSSGLVSFRILRSLLWSYLLVATGGHVLGCRLRSCDLPAWPAILDFVKNESKNGPLVSCIISCYDEGLITGPGKAIRNNR